MTEQQVKDIVISMFDEGEILIDIKKEPFESWHNVIIYSNFNGEKKILSTMPIKIDS